jgi:hypothetical protein
MSKLSAWTSKGSAGKLGITPLGNFKLLDLFKTKSFHHFKTILTDN